MVRVGDRVVGAIALPDLEPLLRRRQPPATCAVDVLRVPDSARDWLVGLIRTLRCCTDEEAVRALDPLPLRLADGLTHGQAEDLLAQLARERIEGKRSSAATESLTSR
jgi:hypothetical protein